jgi:TolB protein
MTPTPTSTATSTPTPTPLPGASLLALETYRDGNGEIYLLDTDSGELTNLSRHPAHDRAPAWRPDGGAIAFESRRDGNWELYLLDLASGEVTRLTDNLAYDGAPAWSPSGQQVAFESYRDGNLEIYTLDLASGDVARLTEHPAGDYGPAWSPNGDTVAFTSWRDGDQEVYLIPASGGEPQNLSQSPAADQDPAWTPDGATLAFTSWRDVDPKTGNRNAEIYQVALSSGEVQRLTENPWPDLDPTWDAAGRLSWAAYDPGPPFETYDPYRPGDYHLYRLENAAPVRLTNTNWDDRRPAPAPPSVPPLADLAGRLPALPPAPEPVPTLAPGVQARIVQVPSILANYTQEPVRVHELVAPSLVAWQQDVADASGWDFLALTLGAWRSIDQVRKREMYAYDYGYLSWHKAGRALDLALEYKVEGIDQLLQVRDDLGANTYWRLYLRAARQDGSLGEPLKDNPWLYWWHIVPEEEPAAYDAGGKRRPIPSGYYVDVTAIAKAHGWERIAAYAIEGDYHWASDSNATEYWHYERTDGLPWWDAVRQLYSLEEMEKWVGWEAGLDKAQTEDMMRSKGIPAP